MAMIAAAAFAVQTREPAGRGRPDEGKAQAAKEAGISAERFSQALTVKRYAPHLVQGVIEGNSNVTLDRAYVTALANKRDLSRIERAIRLLKVETAAWIGLYLSALT